MTRADVGPVYGTSWRRHGPRRQRAARVARLLRPAVHLQGGYTSTEIVVRFPQGWYRPDVAVQVGGQMPADGLLARAPTLVVHLGGPLTPRQWVMAGATVVWTCVDGAATVVTRRGTRPVAPDDWLSYPGEPAVRLAARELGAARVPVVHDAGAAVPVADATVGAARVPVVHDAGAAVPVADATIGA